MNPSFKFYASLTLFVLLLFALAAALVQLVRDLRRSSMWDKLDAEMEAEAAARQVRSLIHKRRGFFSVSARVPDGRLIELERFASFEDAQCFVEQTGIERIYAMAEEKAPAINKKPRRVSQKALKRQQMIEAQMNLRKDLFIRQ